MVTRKMRKSLITNRKPRNYELQHYVELLSKLQNLETLHSCRMSSKYILWDATNRRGKYIRENYLYLCKYILSNKTFTRTLYESTILYNLHKMIQHAKFNWTKVGLKVILLEINRIAHNHQTNKMISTNQKFKIIRKSKWRIKEGVTEKRLK